MQRDETWVSGSFLVESETRPHGAGTRCEVTAGERQVLPDGGHEETPLLAVEARIARGSLLVTAAVMIVVAMMEIVPRPAILSVLTIRTRCTRGQSASGLGAQTRCAGNSCHP